MGASFPDSKLVVFDNGLGVRTESTTLETGRRYELTRIGGRGGRRYYVPENLATMAALSSLGPVGSLHPYLRKLDRCGAVLDVSGGDSFSDIYGSHRFWSIIRPKLIAKRRGVPLVLLPQTYGPFRGRRARRLAREAVVAARMAWARDRYSFQLLQELLGDEFDESRHLEGVDMAFNLGAVHPGEKLGEEIHEWIQGKTNHPLLGLNVSGLIALDPDQARRRFGFRADYIEALAQLIERVLRDSELRLLLIPHVMTSIGTPGSDADACLRLLGRLSPSAAARVRVTPTSLNEREVKWLISQMDWFCGTRMHATIAALSSRVPTAAIAYSDKTRGVFESCGVENQVIDPRRLDTQGVMNALMEAFEDREQTKQVLATTIGGVKTRAAEQLRSITDMLSALR